MLTKKEVLYSRYIDELSMYFSEPIDYNDDRIKETVSSYLKNKETKWTDIKQNGKTVGFLITSKARVNPHLDGIYICDAYIIPESRHKRLMKTALEKELDGFHGIIYYEVQSGNLFGDKFWKTVMSEFHYALLQESDSESSVKGLKSFIWKTS